MLDGGLLRYVGLGATHMLTGQDHLLFLFGVIFFLASARDIVKFISVFTLGHSLTLLFATFAGVSANDYLVDAVIALSVCYEGFDDNGRFGSYLGIKAPNLLGMVFAFGLISDGHSHAHEDMDTPDVPHPLKAPLTRRMT